MTHLQNAPATLLRSFRSVPLSKAIIGTVLLLVILVLAACGSSPGKHGSTPTPVVTVPPTTVANKTPTPTPIPGRPVVLSSIHMLDETTGWAITTESHIVRTTDGGTSWKDVTPTYPAHALAPEGISTDFLSGDLAWVAVSQQQQSIDTFPTTVFRTIDGGQTWQSAMLPSSQLGVSQVTFVDAQNGWVISSFGGVAAGSQEVDIFHTTDGGKTWVTVTHTSPTNGNNSGALPLGGDKSGFSFVNASTGWAAGVTARENFVWLYVTHDSGVTWQHQTLPFPSNVAETFPPTFFTANDGILPAMFDITPNGSSLYFYVTHDGGTTWASPTQTPVPVSTSDFIDVQHGWVIGSDATTLYATQDGGNHWTKITPSPNFKNVYRLDFVSVETGWAIGRATSETQTTPFLLKTEDGGHTWMTVNPTVSG